jgi:cell fate regulator YaaT (PSP1 superfamily)
LSTPIDPPPGALSPQAPVPAEASVPAASSLQYVVRFGAMRFLGVMESSQTFAYGDEVIARTDRGTEIATVLCEATPAAHQYMVESTQGKILRLINADDDLQRKHLRNHLADSIQACNRCIENLGLSMELVDVEQILGGERVVVYYLAESRVDFRQLVRDLAAVFRTRIEMKQIGVRDEAKLLADYGDCGQPICCSRFLSKMPPVSMKMAKVQKATLDPNKISGRCGRLKCCLRYEFDTYESLAAQLPPIGSLVLTRDGNVTVLAQDILSGQMMVGTEDKRRVMIQADDVIKIIEVGRAADSDSENAFGKPSEPERNSH